MTSTGPYLKAALLCDQVVEGKDGVLSLIRVVDRLTITAAGSSPPKDMPVNSHRMVLVLMFVSGRAHGTQEVEVKLEGPDFLRTLWQGTILLEGDDKGANLVIAVEYPFEQQGLYWFHVSLENEELTRIPFRLIYHRVGSPGTQSP